MNYLQIGILATFTESDLGIMNAKTIDRRLRLRPNTSTGETPPYSYVIEELDNLTQWGHLIKLEPATDTLGSYYLLPEDKGEIIHTMKAILAAYNQSKPTQADNT